MAEVAGQTTFGTSPTALFIMPPGPGIMTVYAPTYSSGTVPNYTSYLGFGSGVTVSNGIPVDAAHTYQTAQYAGSPGKTVYVVGGGSPSVLGYTISRP
jgi:hypothetical protein